MRYHNITTDDMVNGEGLRVVLWVAGCNHNCPKCHNPLTHDANGGLPFTEKEEAEIMAELSKKHISGITFSGGDPLHENNCEGVLHLIRKIREDYPDKTIWLYTGYTWETLMKDEMRRPIAMAVDVLVDGRFDYNLLSPTLPWVGSSNQRVIRVKEM